MNQIGLLSRRIFIKISAAVTACMSFSLTLVGCKTTRVYSGVLESEFSDTELSNFTTASAKLTGFSSGFLGNSSAKLYLNDAIKKFTKPKIMQFIEYAATSTESQLEQLVSSDSFGPIARHIIISWYNGHLEHPPEASPTEAAAAAYLTGLVWPAARTKPAGLEDEDTGVWGELPANV